MILYRILSITLAFVNFLLILIALLSPSWTAYYSNLDFLLIGLWTSCSNKFGCYILATFDVFLSFTRTFMIFAFLLSTIALASTVPWDMIFTTFKFPFLLNPLVTAILSTFAGICALLSLILFEIYIHEKEAAADKNTRRWAAYLTYATCVLFFVAGGYNYIVFKFSLWGCCTSSDPTVDQEKSAQDVETAESAESEAVGLTKEP
ncbi:hypothetical protein JD844_005707 [Phrynosoma platyrhinos]|uniref:Uncharacterized protein n=1 Tax=Phrynosoma platyrhinos TaxID=52577 RepID=A0ABQ7TPJ2_PHRPL|nr:hypothetical protein JD844_005707 [Phrynosoma platyrhinos]